MRPEVEAAIRIAEGGAGGFPGGACTQEMLECIDEYVKPGMRTAETGCGRTTGAFVGAGADHVIHEIQRGKANHLLGVFPRSGGPGGRLWIEDRDSAWSLPIRFLMRANHAGPGSMDFALMDGCDNDLTTITDAVYLFKMLKPGGYLLVDDVQQPWVKRAIGVLEEARIEFVKDVGGRSKLYRKAE